MEISQAQVNRLAELYDAAVRTLDPLSLAQKQRCADFDTEVERLYKESRLTSTTLRDFRRKAVGECAKLLFAQSPRNPRPHDSGRRQCES
jgi:hypothetical protein